MIVRHIFLSDYFHIFNPIIVWNIGNRDLISLFRTTTCEGKQKCNCERDSRDKALTSGWMRAKEWFKEKRGALERKVGYITRPQRDSVCRSQERNTIGGDIDLPWELPCATSWRSFARATSRFFFRDSNATRRRRRLSLFPIPCLAYPLFSVIFHRQSELRFRLSLHASANVFRRARSLSIPSCSAISPSFLKPFHRCRKCHLTRTLKRKKKLLNLSVA